jgi:hypothetical protein
MNLPFNRKHEKKASDLRLQARVRLGSFQPEA